MSKKDLLLIIATILVVLVVFLAINRQVDDIIAPDQEGDQVNKAVIHDVLDVRTITSAANAVETPPIPQDEGVTAAMLANGYQGPGSDGHDVYVDPTGQGRDPNSVPWDKNGPIWGWKPSPLSVVLGQQEEE